MYAIIKTGGKQYKVKPEDLIEIESIPGEAGAAVNFAEVLAVGEEGGALKVGTPLVEGASVAGEIVEHFRGPKLVVFKMKRRKGQRKLHGHRQELTRVRISAINA